jgi:hypothetical protein
MRHKHTTRRRKRTRHFQLPAINLKAVIFSILWVVMCFWLTNKMLDVMEDTEYALIEACYAHYEQMGWDGYEAAGECE